METRIIREETFYRIYDKNGEQVHTPASIKEEEEWISKGKAKFLVWVDIGHGYQDVKPVWRKIAKAEKVTRKVIEEIEEVEI